MMFAKKAFAAACVCAVFAASVHVLYADEGVPPLPDGEAASGTAVDVTPPRVNDKYDDRPPQGRKNDNKQNAGAPQEGRGWVPPPSKGEPVSGTGSMQNDHSPRRPEKMPPGLTNEIITLKISGIVYENKGDGIWTQVWNDESTKNTIPGRPVTVRMTGENLLIVAQFTPRYYEGGGVLIVKGQVLLKDKDNTRGLADIQYIPFKFGKKIYYCPLGERNEKSVNFIEICIELNQYTEPETE
jgi:hypothetical protein